MAKRRSGRTPWIVLVLAVAAFVLQYPLKYHLGYYEASLMPLYWNFVLWVTSFGLFLILLILCFNAFTAKEGRLNVTLALAAFMILEILGPLHVIPRPRDYILYGMRDRLLHDYSLETIRNFAGDFDKLPVIPDNSPWRKIYWRSDIAPTGLSSKYPFLAWLQSPQGDASGPSYVAEYDNVIDARWGGSLYGH